MNEHGVAFNARTGHNHDGVNSAPIALAEGLVELRHLSSELLEYLNDFAGSGIANINTGFELVAVPDLIFDVENVPSGGYLTGEILWVNQAVVRYLQIESTEGSLCDITFYHDDSFTNEVREFKAQDCTDGFLWEGLWAHSDDSNSSKVYYKIENRSDSERDFTITLKSSTMVANDLGSGGIEDQVPAIIGVKMGSLFAIVNYVFLLSGGSVNMFNTIFTYWMGIAPEELGSSVTYSQYINSLAMVAQVQSLCEYARTFGVYEAFGATGTIGIDGTVTIHLDTPVNSDADTGNDLHYVWDLTAPVFFQVQIEVTGGSATCYSYQLDTDDPRIFTGAVVPSGYGGSQNTFGYSTSTDGMDIMFDVPGATDGTVQCVAAFKKLVPMEGLLEALL